MSTQLSREGRRFVDHRDPMGRPFDYLTPDRSMQVYPGMAVGGQSLARVVRGTRGEGREIELHARVSLPLVVPLALRERRSAQP